MDEKQSVGGTIGGRRGGNVRKEQMAEQGGWRAGWAGLGGWLLQDQSGPGTLHVEPLRSTDSTVCMWV
jgi:hypothetical protein